MKHHNQFHPGFGARFQSRDNLVIILYEPPFAEGEHEANAATSLPWESLAETAGTRKQADALQAE